MSRFLPDSLLDAFQLPLAMVQFKSNVYIEAIAPESRAAALIILLLVFALRMLPRFTTRFGHSATINSARTIPTNTTAGKAVMASTLTIFVAWIATSANGRYGLVALTLLAPAILVMICGILKEHHRRLIALLAIFGMQLLLVGPSNPGNAWGELSHERWSQPHADKYSSDEVLRWRNIAQSKPTLVVSTQSLTGMSLVYQIFGPAAKYMALSYLDNETGETRNIIRARTLASEAAAIYLTRALPPNIEEKLPKQATGVGNEILPAEMRILAKFGLNAPQSMSCTFMSARMNALIQICSLLRKEEIISPPEPTFQNGAEVLMKRLGEKCPRSFGKYYNFRQNSSESAFTTQDAKYYITITSDNEVYLRHRTEIQYRKVISHQQAVNIDALSCDDILQFGSQYWRGV